MRFNKWTPDIKNLLRRPRGVYLVIGLWIGIILSCFAGFLLFATRPGERSLSPKLEWPTISNLSQSDAPLLLVFIHPLCTCSLATLGEVERLMPSVKDKVTTKIVFTHIGSEFSDSNILLKKARKIPGVQVFIDKDNFEAGIFGVRTSGQTFLYSNRKLVYNGGLTPSRGHMGDNFGTDAILNWSSGREIASVGSVFGCALDKRNQDLDLSFILTGAQREE